MSCHYSVQIHNYIITGWIYPIVNHWVWGLYGPQLTSTDMCEPLYSGTGTRTANGWLLSLGFHDYSGSGAVHLLGGTVAAVACIFMGPRKGRFREDGSPVDIPGHSVPLTFIGGFILFFGFLAFNGVAEVTRINDITP